MCGFATLRRRRLTLNFVPRISSFVHSNSDLSPIRLTERKKIHFSVPRYAEVPIVITCIVICGVTTLFAGILLELNEKTCYFSSWLIDFDFLVLFINNQPLKT